MSRIGLREMPTSPPRGQTPDPQGSGLPHAPSIPLLRDSGGQLLGRSHWPGLLKGEDLDGPPLIQSHALWRLRGKSVKPQAVEEELEACLSMLPQGTGNPDCEVRAPCQTFPSAFDTLTWESEVRPKKNNSDLWLVPKTTMP